MIHRRVFKSTDSGLILMEEADVPAAANQSAKKRASTLVHTRSLDDLLDGGKGSVVLALKEDRKAKYSRVVITASLDALNDEKRLQPNSLSSSGTRT